MPGALVTHIFKEFSYVTDPLKDPYVIDFQYEAMCLLWVALKLSH